MKRTGGEAVGWQEEARKVRRSQVDVNDEGFRPAWAARAARCWLSSMQIAVKGWHDDTL